MRARDFLQELKSKKNLEPKVGDTTPHDYNPGWQTLNDLKASAKLQGDRMAGSFQLFVPRPNAAAMTARDRRLKNLSTPWAWDDEGNLKPDYERWEKGQRYTNEAAPILKPGRATSPPGNNKPQADLWTSTAQKEGDGWTSEWAEWISTEQPDWMSDRGYLYRVRPGALILSLNHDRDAKDIFHAFQQLGRVGEPPESYRNDRELIMRSKFPWDQIARHFDAVTHSAWSREGFMYGWDVESTAWFDTSFLELVGEVSVKG